MLNLLSQSGVHFTANTALPQAFFIHGDFSPQHVFSDGKEITGLIDLSACYAGDPHVDIANMQYFLDPIQLKAFNQGYGPLANDELTPFCSVLAVVNKVAYHADRGFTDRLPGSLEKLAQKLKELD